MINLEKATYDVICQFGNLDDFKKKLEMNGDTIDAIKNKKDHQGFSLLEHALASIKFDIADYLIENNAEINVKTDDGNEFHMIAYRLYNPGGVEMAYRLLDFGVSLNIQDKKYKNTGFITLCNGIFPKRREPEVEFLAECLRRGNVDLNIKNVIGKTPRDFINDRGPDCLKEIIKSV